MNYSARALLLAAVLTVAPGLALSAEKTYDVAPFTAIDISSGVNAIVTVGGAQSVRAESPRQEEIDDLIVEVRDGKLIAKFDWDLLDLLFVGDRKTKVFVTVPSLDSAEASSGADVDVTGIAADAVKLHASSGADLDAKAVKGKSFDIEASSGADLTIDGICETAKAEASSGGTLRAEKLSCTNVEVESSSGADADVFASAAVTAKASSGAGISIYGKPAKVEQDESSGGDVEIED